MSAKGSPGRRTNDRLHKIKRRHYWHDAEHDAWVERAGFTEAEAREAARRILDLTGKSYWPYPCATCERWHIRRRRRPEDLARPA